MIKINCDIGEREPENPVDIELMSYIHIANIACGGHAGNEETVSVFRHLAGQNGVEVAAHLSYPDKENFGRVSMDISGSDLFRSLDEQYAMMSDVKMVKFHGGLYNDCCIDKELASVLAKWLRANTITQVITPGDSELAMAVSGTGIDIVAEAFAERRYAYDSDSGRLSLVSRTMDYASIHDCDEAIRHSLNIVQNGFVDAIIDKNGDTFEQLRIDIVADTICIHSDSDISLDLARRLSELRN